jgi:hypothetical protein
MWFKKKHDFCRHERLAIAIAIAIVIVIAARWVI